MRIVGKVWSNVIAISSTITTPQEKLSAKILSVISAAPAATYNSFGLGNKKRKIASRNHIILKNIIKMTMIPAESHVMLAKIQKIKNQPTSAVNYQKILD